MLLLAFSAHAQDGKTGQLSAFTITYY